MIKKICFIILIFLSGFAFSGNGSSKVKSKKKKKEVVHVRSYDFYTEPENIEPDNDLFEVLLPKEIWYIIVANFRGRDHESLLSLSKRTRKTCLLCIHYLSIRQLAILRKENLEKLIEKYPNITRLHLAQSLGEGVGDRLQRIYDEYPNIDFSSENYFDLGCLGYFKKLEFVALGSGQFCDSNVKQLPIGLKRLRLCGSNIRPFIHVITDNGLSHLSTLTNLEDLALAFKEIDGSSLSKLTGLQNLSLDYIIFKDDGYKHIGKLTNLKRLEIDYDEKLGKKEIGYLSSLSNLSCLILGRVGNLENEDLEELSNKLPNLKDIKVRYCKRYSKIVDGKIICIRLESIKKRD